MTTSEKTSSTHSNRQWTNFPEMNKDFIDLCVNEIVVSGHQGTSLKGSSWKTIRETLLHSDLKTQTKMKHIFKILTLLVAITAFWIGLLEASIVPRSYAWLLPVYFIVSLGCYGLLMVGVGLMRFPTCPQEAGLLQKDIIEAKEFLKQRGVDVGSD